MRNVLPQGGFPLAAVFSLLPEFSGLRFELVERMEKRCSFLENCAAILGLKNVSVVNSEAERLPEAAYDLITFRAFRPLDKKMTKTLLRIVKPQGFLCAYKAKEISIKEEMDVISSPERSPASGFFHRTTGQEKFLPHI